MSLHLILPILALACAPEGPIEPVGEGTEIGEEGGGDGECSEVRTPLGGPDAIAPGFDHSVVELVERWEGTFVADGATLTVTTDPSAPVFISREPPEDEPGIPCFDTVEVPATVGFGAEELVLETPAGTVEIEQFDYIHVTGSVTVYDAETGANGISDDGVEAIPDDPGTLSATSGPETLARSDMSSIGVRIDASGDPDGWFTRAIWRGLPIESETWQDEDIWLGPMPAD